MNWREQFENAEVSNKDRMTFLTKRRSGLRKKIKGLEKKEQVNPERIDLQDRWKQLQSDVFYLKDKQYSKTPKEKEEMNKEREVKKAELAEVKELWHNREEQKHIQMWKTELEQVEAEIRRRKEDYSFIPKGVIHLK